MCIRDRGDHSGWRITGLDVKSDGNVYVMGNVNNWGPPAIRRYSADGTYRSTVYPPPAGKPVGEVKGWGVNVRADGTWTPGYSDLSSPALSKTRIAATRGACASLVPSPDDGTVTINPTVRLAGHPNALMTIGVDGTLRDRAETPLFAGAPADKGVFGPFSCAYTKDRKTMYVTGLFSCKHRYGAMIEGVHNKGLWRDGQVWKVDVATRKAEVFFAIPAKDVIGDMKARAASPIGHSSKYWAFAAFHGVAVDAEGNVLVGDRQNKRIVALDKAGKIIREIPVMHVDALALDPGSKALYATTRTGSRGKITLLKFGDWTRDSKPAVTLQVCKSYMYSPCTFLGVARSKGKSLIWLAYTTLPVRVYQDDGTGPKLLKDFYEAGPQRFLDLQHMAVDPVTENVYFADGFMNCFKLTDWKKPKFTRCMTGPGERLHALSLGIDHRNRWLYAKSDRCPVGRYKLDGEFINPAPVGGRPAPVPRKRRKYVAGPVTPVLSNDWRIGLGLGDRGIAAAPDGSVATLGAMGRGADYSGYLRFFKADPARAPWKALDFKGFTKVAAAGARFDVKGNLYAGKLRRGRSKAGIYKYAPTGPMGNLFPTEPKAPAKVYAADYGYPAPAFTRTPRFGVDGWGRIYYPTSLLPKVSVIDNEGNPVLSFGTYGNRDSMGGLKGDLVPTKDVPMAWPNSVDATDDYIYVSDIVNIRLLRLAKTFAATGTVKIQ